MKKRSFHSYFNLLLQECGFVQKTKSYWYLDSPKGLIVVNLQKSSSFAGFYINFGLTFDKTLNCPKEYDCDVFGRNPCLSKPEMKDFQDLLENWSDIVTKSEKEKQFRSYLKSQIECLCSWLDAEALKKRIQSKVVLEMIVNRVRLGLPR